MGERTAGVTREGCEARQRRLAEALGAAGLDAAVICHPGHIYALSGFWTRGVFDRMLLLDADGETTLAVGNVPEGGCFATRTVLFQGSFLGTLVEDPMAEAAKALAPQVAGAKRIGTDQLRAGLLAGGRAAEDIGPLLRRLRKRKEADEVALIERAVGACESAYEVARVVIEPGLSEWDLYLQVHAAALAAAGEPIGELGNDFQAGGGGGAARHRAMEAGELLPLDLSAVIRGYSADLCRTFCVGGRPTDLQKEAYRRVMQALAFVEQTVRPGVSCRRIYADVHKMLEGHRDWIFPHHLGHGIGLSAHETPRLNPHWDDVFEEGDVFTAEPGVYSPELRGGLRLEENYVVTATGIRRLSTFSLYDYD